jgi:hypothetical protein
MPADRVARTVNKLPAVDDRRTRVSADAADYTDAQGQSALVTATRLVATKDYPERLAGDSVALSNIRKSSSHRSPVRSRYQQDQ